MSGVQARGKAELGDKTMLDALIPARDAFAAAVADGAELPAALRRSADAAEEGMTATIPLVARKGRASYLGERSAGHQDPGATSTYLLLRTVADTWVGDDFDDATTRRRPRWLTTSVHSTRARPARAS